MCHEYSARSWDRTTARETDDDEEETPEFLNEDGGDVEVLTDGGE
jgi:hypothetical protein